MRLDKFLAEASVGSKKNVRNYIKDGRVSVNNQTVDNPAIEINEVSDEIKYLDEIVVHTGKVYYMFHKPKGCITATKDVKEKTVLDYIQVEHRKGLFPVGRLDKDTEGLLLMTNDGEFSHRLMHPDKYVEKTYFFWAFGSLGEEKLEQLRLGIPMGDEEPLAKAVRIEIETKGFYHDFEDKLIDIKVKEIRFHPTQQPVVSGYITITEGRKHQVKRMLKAIGCCIVYLKRVSIGPLMLDSVLEKGQYRELTKEEIRMLS